MTGEATYAPPTGAANFAAAPFFAEVADGPDSGHAIWADCDDGVAVRVGLWPCKGARGTVLLFPGRTEYVEKYGRAARVMADAGYAMASIDWRGQGLAARDLDDRNTGHVHRFTDYQRDVAAMRAAIRHAGLPAPLYLLAHSMGGAIGLRAVIEELPVAACAFTAPMWGIALSPPLRPLAGAITGAARKLRLGHLYAPGTRPETYVVETPFEGNALTRDPEMYDYMLRQLRNHPDLSLGGPSMHWVNEALAETRQLAALTSPDLPCVTFLGGKERIIDPGAIHDRMARWPGGRLVEIPDAEHEVLMELPEVRSRVFTETVALFDAHPA